MAASNLFSFLVVTLLLRVKLFELSCASALSRPLPENGQTSPVDDARNEAPNVAIDDVADGDFDLGRVGGGPSSSEAARVPVTFETLSDLPYDENGRLSTHLLLYPLRCNPLIFYDGHYRAIHPVSGEAEVAFFGPTTATAFDGNDHDGNRRATGNRTQQEQSDDQKRCRAVCVERGTDRTVISDVMPEYHFNPWMTNPNYRVKESLLGSVIRNWMVHSCDKVEMGYINLYNAKTSIRGYWIDKENGGTRHYNGDIMYGMEQMRFIDTYLGHTFLFVDGNTGQTLLEHTVEYNGVITIGESPSLIDDPSMWNANKTEESIRRVFEKEWFRHNRIKRSFSTLGFTKGRLPNDVFASMAAYYYNNAHSDPTKTLEDRNQLSLYVNWWEAVVSFIQIPWKLKILWQTRLRSLVEDWVGLPLENTDIYGMRRYESGARLLVHVDRELTHATSLIVNVAQGNVTKPWVVDIFDHADRLHEIPMIPGDVVFYESAKCLHGRMNPLNGGYYVNLFAHYRPAVKQFDDGGKWFTRENPPGTPKPLMDAGRCWLLEKDDERGRVGNVRIKCDNPDIGHYLSASMFRPKGWEELFDWWKRVSEEEASQQAEEDEEKPIATNGDNSKKVTFLHDEL